MSTEIVTHAADGALSMAEQWRFAETVSGSSILPRAYREDPGAVLVAVNLGAAMGLAPAEALYRIHVIEGKPSASAELITANVRKAGHRLRVRATNETATAEIVRADDPDFTYEVTWTIQDAQRAGLAGKDVWKKYPSSMLRARAITECARMACPEALYGVIYTPEEAQDASADDGSAAPRRQSAADVLTGGTTQAPPAQATVVDPPEGKKRSEDEIPDGITDAQQRKLGALMREAGITERDHALSFVSQTIGRVVGSRSELTKAEAGAVIDALEADAAQSGGAS